MRAVLEGAGTTGSGGLPPPAFQALVAFPVYFATLFLFIARILARALGVPARRGLPVALALAPLILLFPLADFIAVGPRAGQAQFPATTKLGEIGLALVVGRLPGGAELPAGFQAQWWSLLALAAAYVWVRTGKPLRAALTGVGVAVMTGLLGMVPALAAIALNGATGSAHGFEEIYRGENLFGDFRDAPHKFALLFSATLAAAAWPLVRSAATPATARLCVAGAASVLVGAAGSLAVSWPVSPWTVPFLALATAAGALSMAGLAAPRALTIGAGSALSWIAGEIFLVVTLPATVAASLVSSIGPRIAAAAECALALALAAAGATLAAPRPSPLELSLLAALTATALPLLLRLRLRRPRPQA